MADENAGYSPVSISKKNNGGRTKPKLAKIVLFRLNDAEKCPKPDTKGVLVKEDIVLKTDAKAIFIETTASTIAISQTSEGDPDNKGYKQKPVSYTHLDVYKRQLPDLLKKATK